MTPFRGSPASFVWVKDEVPRKKGSISSGPGVSSTSFFCFRVSVVLEKRGSVLSLNSIVLILFLWELGVRHTSVPKGIDDRRPSLEVNLFGELGRRT